jgi:aspartyl-tRNA synthetase
LSRSLLEMGRSHNCGVLRKDDVGEQTTLMGWVHNRRDHGGAIFIDLRDRYGVTQIVFRQDANEEAHRLASELRSEFCIAVHGQVECRGENVNPKLPTGTIEVIVDDLEIFSQSETPPFLIEDEIDTGESVRLQYRYLDLRRPSVQKNFLTRSAVSNRVRSFLSEEGYIELETPFLIKNTPGGARNFLVPSRMSSHDFYALAESPQLYKQLFMVAGFDRYFQIVRCFRDEDLRGDRQPEFTQVDIELSFAKEDTLYEMMERMMAAIFKDVLDFDLPTPFPRLTYKEAIARYGSDKPDLRFDLPLTEITDLVGGCGFRIFEGAVESGAIVKALRVPQAAKALSRKVLDSLPELVKPVGAKGVAYARIQEGGTWQAPFAKAMTAESMVAINERVGAEVGDVVLFLADQANIANNALTLLRRDMADRFDLIDKKSWSPVWITEFPLLEKSEETNQWVACHHPFTFPHPEDIELLNTDRQGEIRARAYDMVLNGVEVGGGSIRIHQEELQNQVFRAIGIDEEEAQSKFSFLLEAFRYGPPPHGGIALGLDRLIMLLCGTDSLRDVIAFPKTQRGTCALTGAPSAVTQAQLDELHVQLKR